jgi:hypothetical protein
MEQNKLRTIIFYGIIVVIVLLSLYVLYYTRTEGYKCMLSPLVYGVNHIHASDSSPITCTCNAGKESGNLFVTKDNITLVP